MGKVPRAYLANVTNIVHELTTNSPFQSVMNSFHIQPEPFVEYGSYHIPILSRPSCSEDDFHSRHDKIYKCKFSCSMESENIVN